MSNEWVYGEYKGVVDVIDRGEKGPWALLDAYKIDDEDNSPLIQVGLTEMEYSQLREDDEVMFILTRASDGNKEVDVTYLDALDQVENVYIKELKRL